MRCKGLIHRQSCTSRIEDLSYSLADPSENNNDNIQLDSNSGHCHDKFIDLLKQNYDDKDSMKGVNIISQPTTLLNEMDDLFSDLSLVDQLAEDASGNSIEDELGCYLNDGRYKPGAGEDKSPLCWWKDNKHRFPWLAWCACNVLMIPGMLHSAFISL